MSDERSFCNKCGFFGVADEQGIHNRPYDDEQCHYLASPMGNPVVARGRIDLINNIKESDEAATVRFINKLRAYEGDSVTILCDNPDFNGQPNCAILCNGAWTDYDDLRFTGDTVLQCLARACMAKDSWHQREDRENRHD